MSKTFIEALTELNERLSKMTPEELEAEITKHLSIHGSPTDEECAKFSDLEKMILASKDK